MMGLILEFSLGVIVIKIIIMVGFMDINVKLRPQKEDGLVEFMMKQEDNGYIH